jgi:hypothetical protein
MKMIVKILIVIVVIVAIPFIIALFIKNEYTVEREVSINKLKNEVFNYIKFSKNQDYYNKWVMKDPNMKKNFKGTDGTVGFIYAWDGNKQAGKGEQEIKKITEGESVDNEIRFIRPFEAIAHTYMTTESLTGNQTKVRWRIVGISPYPMNFMNLFIGNLLGKDLDTSLSTLKSILEK